MDPEIPDYDETVAIARPAIRTGVSVLHAHVIEADDVELCRFYEDGSGVVQIHKMTRRQFIALTQACLSQLCALEVITGDAKIDDIQHHLDMILARKVRSDKYAKL